MKNRLTYCKIWFVFQTKDKIVYKLQYGSCSATYYGKTKRHLKVRMCEHLGILALTRKRVKGDDESDVKEYLLFCNHSPDFKDFSIYQQQRL